MIAASGACCSGDFSEIAMGNDRPTETEAPSTPSGLEATAASSSRIDLTWTAATDNVGVTGYHVLRDGTQVGEVADTAYTDTGLSASTTYTYTIAAYDDPGNVSSKSASVSATTSGAKAGDSAALYGVWEMEVRNGARYSNPFDYREIELQATFTAPSGRTVNFFGFHAGDGEGGQSGDVWKLRFMPDEVGEWSYAYSWTDGTAGGGGSFLVEDTGLRGPLRTDPGAPWYFEDARGSDFDAIPYDLHTFAAASTNHLLESDVDELLAVIDSDVIAPGRNLVVLDGAMNKSRNTDRNFAWWDSWWATTTDEDVFDVAVWAAFEHVLDRLHANGVYAFVFSGLIHQDDVGDFASVSDYYAVLRYWLARFAPYYNFFGWSPTWEWYDVFTASEMDGIMSFLHNNDPWTRPLGVHDDHESTWTEWGTFVPRQCISNTLRDGNRRDCTGGTPGSRTLKTEWQDRPQIGAEDLWWSSPTHHPETAAEMRRAAWGLILAGIIPVYSEYNLGVQGTGRYASEVYRALDWLYANTSYRTWTQKNGLVNGTTRVAAGQGGVQYAVFAERGGDVTIDLSTESGTWHVLWWNATNGSSQSGGTVTAGASRTLANPYTVDSVLLLSAQ